MGKAGDEPQTPVAGTVRLRPDGVGLVVSGDFDLHSAPALLDQLPRLLGNCRDKGLGQAEIDCAGLTLCDSSGLTALIRAHQAAQQADISLVLIDQPGQLTHLLDLAGLSRMFEQ
jgi:anti-sigma B factor antagonist